MWGLTDLETVLTGALVAVMICGAVLLASMTEAHMTRRDQRRRARTAHRAAQRRQRGITVRPRE